MFQQELRLLIQGQDTQTAPSRVGQGAATLLGTAGSLAREQAGSHGREPVLHRFLSSSPPLVSRQPQVQLPSPTTGSEVGR